MANAPAKKVFGICLDKICKDCNDSDYLLKEDEIISCCKKGCGKTTDVDCAYDCDQVARDHTSYNPRKPGGGDTGDTGDTGNTGDDNPHSAWDPVKNMLIVQFKSSEKYTELLSKMGAQAADYFTETLANCIIYNALELGYTPDEVKNILDNDKKDGALEKITERCYNDIIAGKIDNDKPKINLAGITKGMSLDLPSWDDVKDIMLKSLMDSDDPKYKNLSDSDKKRYINCGISILKNKFSTVENALKNMDDSIEKYIDGECLQKSGTDKKKINKVWLISGGVILILLIILIIVFFAKRK